MSVVTQHGFSITTKYLYIKYYILEFRTREEHLNTSCILTITIKIRILIGI